MALNAGLTTILQENFLKRMFEDALFPQLLYRADATPEKFEGNIGEEKIITRTGNITPNITPLAPGTDPTPKSFDVEQFRAILSQYGDAIDTHMPSAFTVIPGKFLQDAKKLGMQAGQSINRLVRNRLFAAYSGGNTVTRAVAAIGATSAQVASINGFTEALDATGSLNPVSAANPIAVTFSGGEPTRNVVGATPDNPAAPLGPGTLTFSAALTVGLLARATVISNNAPTIFRVGGGTSVDAIGAADTLGLNDIIGAAQVLSGNNVERHPDRWFHHHLSSAAVGQLMTDSNWLELHQGQSEGIAYRENLIGLKAKCAHYENTESPDSLNTGTLVSSGAGASFTSPEIGAEVINNAGVRIGRTIMTGLDSCYEEYIPENTAYMNESGVTGKIGDFQITNEGVTVMTDRIRYILRNPLDRLQQVYSHAWSFSGDWVIPSDQLSGSGVARFKRAIIIEHAIA
jgi:hypothetical protein